MKDRKKEIRHTQTHTRAEIPFTQRNSRTKMERGRLAWFQSTGFTFFVKAQKSWLFEGDSFCSLLLSKSDLFEGMSGHLWRDGQKWGLHFVTIFVSYVIKRGKSSVWESEPGRKVYSVSIVKDPSAQRVCQSISQSINFQSINKLVNSFSINQ